MERLAPVYRFLLKAVVLASTALLPQVGAGEHAVRYEADHRAMGTIFTVVIYGQDRNYLAEVTDLVFDEIDRLDAQMSNYRSESEISVINRVAVDRAVPVEPGLFRLLERALNFSRETDGAFDITVGPLMKAWGFFRGQGRLPTQAEREKIIKSVGYRHLCLDAATRRIQFRVKGLKVDLGGIAKGYAVDQVISILRERGISSALVSSGTSSVYALGSPPGEDGWKLTVRHPSVPDRAVDTLRLKNCSLSTSGSYEKFFRMGSKTYAHLIDPRTGLPAENMLATTVTALSAVDSDALSTAFFVLGVDGTRKYLRSHPNLQTLLYMLASGEQNLKRVVLRSDSYALPEDVLARIE